MLCHEPQKLSQPIDVTSGGACGVLCCTAQKLLSQPIDVTSGGACCVQLCSTVQEFSSQR